MRLETLRGRVWWCLIATARLFVGFRGSRRGVKAIVLDDRERVLLVLPRYSDEWMLPGGGVGRGELTETATRREVFEESGAVVGPEPMELLGRYRHRLFGKVETVDVFIGRSAVMLARRWSLEIRSAAFFRLDDLPRRVYASTGRRLAEYQSGRRDIISDW